MRKKRQGKKIKKGERVAAYHEAGRAVAACLVRERFRSATIVPDEQNRRKCSVPWRRDFHPDRDPARLSIKRARAFIFIHLAGPTAEAMFRAGKKYPRLDSPEHSEQCFDLASRLTHGLATAKAYMNFMQRQTEDILDIYWPAVRAVATALLKRKTLRPQDVRQLIKEARLSLIAPVELL